MHNASESGTQNKRSSWNTLWLAYTEGLREKKEVVQGNVYNEIEKRHRSFRQKKRPKG